MRLTVARLAVALLLTSLLIVNLVWSISRHFSGRQSNLQFTPSRSKKPQKDRQKDRPPPQKEQPPPPPIASALTST